jgi:hypothetical protein
LSGTCGIHQSTRISVYSENLIKRIKYLCGHTATLLHLKGGGTYYYYYYYYKLQLSCHSLAAVLTPVQSKQVRINIHKRNSTQIQCKQYKTQVHTLPKHPHITKQVKTTTVQDTHQYNQYKITFSPQHKPQCFKGLTLQLCMYVTFIDQYDV